MPRCASAGCSWRWAISTTARPAATPWRRCIRTRSLWTQGASATPARPAAVPTACAKPAARRGAPAPRSAPRASKPASSWMRCVAGVATACRATCWRSRSRPSGSCRPMRRSSSAPGPCWRRRPDRQAPCVGLHDLQIATYRLSKPRAAAVKSASIPKLGESLDSRPYRKEPGVKKGWIWCVLFATLLAGCNTMAGLGQDIQRGGQKLESSADRHK
ncbi:hypothetical protein CBM2626_B120106 [Cupriavidus taiwanensis]|nr:hypothetical protein CBM2626_B120106 [Cupriavidus taiwanensis]